MKVVKREADPRELRKYRILLWTRLACAAIGIAFIVLGTVIESQKDRPYVDLFGG